MATRAPVLRTRSAAVAVAVMSVCAVAASLAAAAGTVSGDPVAGLPLLMAARGGGGSSSRVEDEEPLEMDSEAHRRVVLAALRGGLGVSPGHTVLDRNSHWCEPPCTGGPGDPYIRGCKKIYHCPGAPNALSD